MGTKWWRAFALVIAGCGGTVFDAPETLPSNGGDGGAVDAGAVDEDASVTPPAEGGGLTTFDGDSGSGGGDSGATSEGGSPATDGGADAGPTFPFPSYVVLRLEADAPGGLDKSGVWVDLSSHKQTLTLAGGTSLVASIGSGGAKAMVHDATGPFFDVADSADLRFGATDDFFIVARATIAVPLEGSSGCTFHYLFSKYFTDGASGDHMRVCAPSTGQQLVGSLKLSSPGEAMVNPPGALTSTFGVISFGRNMSGLRVETYAGGTSHETTIASTIDPSSLGSPFVIGGARSGGTGGLFGGYIGRVNRFYVFHAPPGTFATADFDTIRTYVKSATPLPQ